ncbi:basic salivary proline-rich protein 1-like [Symphalangus syndactylus]|uniref:basic salivary proline-rich protein 1-like n=1 Tax=Symphalangus syndactylus TaxID=9590 RepID=UPI0024434CAE|nr:basic salivary proline-rich protein 1-like [Symphalangus syndactylus]
MIRKRPHQQGGGGGLAVTATPAALQAPAHPLPPRGPRGHPSAPPAWHPAARKVPSRLQEQSLPRPQPHTRRGRPSEGRPPPQGAEAGRPPAGKSSPPRDPLSLTAFSGEEEWEEGGRERDHPPTPAAAASPQRHPEGGGHGSPHSRPDQQPGERGAAAALPARAPRPGAPPSPAGAHPALDSPPAGRPCAQSGGVGPGTWSRGRLYVHTYIHTHTHTHRTRRVDFLRSSSSCFPCSRLGFWVRKSALVWNYSALAWKGDPRTPLAANFGSLI